MFSNHSVVDGGLGACTNTALAPGVGTAPAPGAGIGHGGRGGRGGRGDRGDRGDRVGRGGRGGRGGGASGRTRRLGGADWPKNAREANRLRILGKVLILLTFSDQTGVENVPQPCIIGQKLEGDELVQEWPIYTWFQAIRFSKDPGVRMCIKDIQHAKLEQLWAFSFPRQRMQIEDKLLHEEVRWNESEGGDEVEEGEIVEDNTPHALIKQHFAKWAIHDGKMSEHPAILDRIASHSRDNGPLKALTLVTFGYSPQDPPSLVGDNIPEDELCPLHIRLIDRKFRQYNQVTIILGHADHGLKDLFLQLDSSFGRWKAEQ